MDKSEVIEFFDGWAPRWDLDMVLREDLVREILTLAGVGPGQSVLDVACGTGVLFPFYQERQVDHVTAVDISPEMAKRAARKAEAYEFISVLCADAEEYGFSESFDRVMIYNAFPHFPDPSHLIRRMARITKPGGRLCVAHSMSRERVLRHHSGGAARVSRELPEAQELAGMFAPYFSVDVCVSDERMYVVSGTLLPGA